MDICAIKETVKSCVSKAEIPFYDSFTSKKISLDSPVCFYHTPVSQIDSEVLSKAGDIRKTRFKHSFAIEITGRSGVYEAAESVFEMLRTYADLKELKLSELTLSKITRFPSVFISFCAFEIFEEAYEEKDSDRYFSGFGVNGLVDDIKIKQDIYFPTVMLASGKRYYGQPIISGRHVTITGRIISSEADNFITSINSGVGAYTIGADGTRFLASRIESGEITENNGFYAVFNLTVFVSA